MEGIPQQPVDIENTLKQICSEVADEPGEGRVADYIPALASVPSHLCGIALATNDGQVFSAGDANTGFSIQSISKVFALVMAMECMEDGLWQRVRMEPSGLPFNSIVQLESEQGIPRNPVINAGAIVVADVLVSHYSTPKLAFIDKLRELTASPHLKIDQHVYASEQAHGNRNAALGYLMKSFGNIHAAVPIVLEQYFYQCSVSINCQQLARSLLFLSNRGKDPVSGKLVCSQKDAHRLNAILSTSGTYDQSGEFAFTVGLPAKSGVGGAIAAIVPGFGVIVAFSPKLNRFGNSVKGMELICRTAKTLGLSVY